LHWICCSNNGNFALGAQPLIAGEKIRLRSCLFLCLRNPRHENAN
jgi:hypothetical protein